MFKFAWREVQEPRPRELSSRTDYPGRRQSLHSQLHRDVSHVALPGIALLRELRNEKARLTVVTARHSCMVLRCSEKLL